MVQQVVLLHHSSRVLGSTLCSDYCLCGSLHVYMSVWVSSGFFTFLPNPQNMLGYTNLPLGMNKYVNKFVHVSWVYSCLLPSVQQILYTEHACKTENCTLRRKIQGPTLWEQREYMLNFFSVSSQTNPLLNGE